MDIGSSGGKGGGTCVRTREAKHLMTSADEFLNDCGADEACSSGDKDTHTLFSLILTSCHESDKTEMVSALLDYRRLSPVASFLMPKKHSQSVDRKPRSDAQRNRERILEVAKEAFTRSGANTSLDDIAKQAGVGPGTLYRHFPTRDELLEAVYRTEVEKLAAAERKCAETLSPIEALRAWLLLFVDYIAAKQIIAPALHTVAGGPTRL